MLYCLRIKQVQLPLQCKYFTLQRKNIAFMTKEQSILQNLYYMALEPERKHFKSEWLGFTLLGERTFFYRLENPRVIDSYIFHAATGNKYAKSLDILKVYPQLQNIVSFQESILLETVNK